MKPAATAPAGSSPPAAAEKLSPAIQHDAIFATIRDINSDAEVKEIPIDGWRVQEQALGEQRVVDIVPREAQRIVQLGWNYYVAERGTTRWLVGDKAGGEDKLIRCSQSFENFESLAAAAKYADLPKPPAGLAIREVCRLPNSPTRLASDGTGNALYVLCVNGDVWKADLKAGTTAPLIKGWQYNDLPRGEEVSCVGMMLDAEHRLWIVANHKVALSSPITNEVTIFRTTKTDADGNPAEPKAWVRAYYPWGIGPFNHGVGHIAIGPDGMLYVSSGSRTDANQAGEDDRFSKLGEHYLTSCMWRLDPKAEKPQIEIFARGLRNPYGFCWDDQGKMFATDNGPDKDPAEELNIVEQGHHYGFPYKFSDWAQKPYPTTPDAPAGLLFTPPLVNLGPDGGYPDGRPISTFTPHSSPSGIVFLGNDWPEPYRGGFFIARFGNLLELPQDCGFDLLFAKLHSNEKGGKPTVTVHTVLSPIARPVDIHLSGNGKLYICEYSRQVSNKGFAGMLPGRILELSVKTGE